MFEKLQTSSESTISSDSTIDESGETPAKKRSRKKKYVPKKSGSAHTTEELRALPFYKELRGILSHIDESEIIRLTREDVDKAWEASIAKKLNALTHKYVTKLGELGIRGANITIQKFETQTTVEYKVSTASAPGRRDSMRDHKVGPGAIKKRKATKNS